MKLRNNAIRILITNKSIETAVLPQDMDIYILMRVFYLMWNKFWNVSKRIVSAHS